MTPSPPARRPSLGMLGFLAAAIAIVGMLGVMATYITPLPYQRALARDAVFDQLLADNGANYAKLAPQLAESAAAVKPGPDLPARVAAERVAMRARLATYSHGVAMQLRAMIIVCSLGAVLFGWLAMGGRGRR